jgi:XTP/dITP diphosphohydrolase
MALAPLLIASRNRHKASEIQTILGVECRSLLDCPDAPTLIEDAATFAGNAIGKAAQLARWLASAPATQAGVFSAVLADDSGLEVDALGGEPGVHSARFAATDGQGNASDAANNTKLLSLLAEVPASRRAARFRCVLALVALPIQEPIEPSLFEGACEGAISFAPSGAGGFGYDPLFVPLGFQQSFAELGDQVKNRISHRARALAGLRAWLQEHLLR